jgi:hypothetical protein
VSHYIGQSEYLILDLGHRVQQRHIEFLEIFKMFFADVLGDTITKTSLYVE